MPNNSQKTNAINPKADEIVNPTILPSENQSLRWPSSRMYCSEPRPTASSPSPTASTGIGRGFVGLRSRMKMIAAAIAPGTMLMKKTKFQEKLSVSQPPSVGPTLGPTIAPIANRAWLAPSLSRGNVSRSVACAVATRPPPNSPCTIRQKINWPIELEVPQNTEATVNPTIAVP